MRRDPAPGEREGSAAAVDRASLGDLDDSKLIELCAGGHVEAFEIIVDRHRRAVYRLCYRFVNNHEDASDLSQDVFLRAYRGLKSFRGQSSLGTWLYRIGVNVCLNRVSVKAPRYEPLGPLEDRHPDTRIEDPSSGLLRAERAVRVRTAIAQLPPKQRATLVLRVYHDLSHQEIAEILGNSVGAVKANFFHALGNLKKLLGNEPQ